MGFSPTIDHFNLSPLLTEFCLYFGVVLPDYWNKSCCVTFGLPILVGLLFFAKATCKFRAAQTTYFKDKVRTEGQQWRY